MEAFSLFFAIGSGLSVGVFMFLFLPVYLILRRRWR